MTTYIAVDGIDPKALDAADNELISQTVHQLLTEDVGAENIETVGIVEEFESEISRIVVSEENLRVLAEGAAQARINLELDTEDRIAIGKAWSDATSLLHNQDE